MPGRIVADPRQHDVDYGEILNQIDAALNHVTTQRTEAGVRLQLIDNQDNNHQDALINIRKRSFKY